MRGKVDENLPVESAVALRTAGWDCHRCSMKRSTVPRIQILVRDARLRREFCSPWTRTSRIFDRIRRTRSQESSFRPAKPSRDSVLALLKQVIPIQTADWAAHRLWIVEPGRVRIREGGAQAV